MSAHGHATCDEGGPRHTWESRGLDVNAAGVLVNVRDCLRCPASQEKPYGQGGSKPWRARRRPAATEPEVDR